MCLNMYSYEVVKLAFCSPMLAFFPGDLFLPAMIVLSVPVMRH